MPPAITNVANAVRFTLGSVAPIDLQVSHPVQLL